MKILFHNHLEIFKRCVIELGEVDTKLFEMCYYRSGRFRNL